MTFSLIRGLSLLRNRRGEGYLLGTHNRVVAITSASQRGALTELALGKELGKELPDSHILELEPFLQRLRLSGFLTESASELTPPKRHLDEVSDADLAIRALRARSAPEIAKSQWEVGGEDGINAIARRAEVVIELSGRSRVITLLYSILLSSGIARVRFADRHFRPIINEMDIGFGPFTESDLGLNYYQELEMRRRSISLFPIERNARHDLDITKPDAIIHYGDCDPEALMDWSQRGIGHLLIHPPIGDEIALGPLVLPYKSPCIRCFSLYEIDNFGFTQLERLPLTAVNELAAAGAHYVAAIAAAQILSFIDQRNVSGSHTGVNTGIGEVTYINFQRLTEPQVVAIARHPLCGCDL